MINTERDIPYAIGTGGYYQDSTHLGTGPMTFSMIYRDGRYDRLTRRWLGFKEILTQSVEEDVVSGKYFDYGHYDPDVHRFVPPVLRFAWRASGTSFLDDDCEIRMQSFDYDFPSTHNGTTFSIRAQHRRDAHLLHEFCVAPSFLPGADANPNAVTVSASDTNYDIYDDYDNVWLATQRTDGIIRSTRSTFSYRNDDANWLIGLPRSAQICSTTEKDSACRTRTWDYTDTGLLKTETFEPADPAHQLTTTLDHDDYGNVIHVSTVSAATGETRESCTSYEPYEYIFPFASKNPLGHLTYTEYDVSSGRALQVVDPNSLHTRYSYDGFGRFREQVNPDGTVTLATYSLVNFNGESRIHLNIQYSSGADEEREYDTRGRLARRWTPIIGVADRAVEAFQYDPRGGQVTWHQLPTNESAHGTGPIEQRAYDDWGRLILRTAPDQSTTSHVYLGAVEDIFDAKNYMTAVFHDPAERVSSVVDASGPTTYEYGPFDTLASVTDPDGHVSTSIADAYGRPIDEMDPDRGHTSYTYDAFGQLTTAKDAANRTTTIYYDKLGRPFARQNPDGLSTWWWDSSDHGIGRIGGSESSDHVSNSFSYDQYGRANSVSMIVANQRYTTSVDYDANGRLSTVTYPSNGGPFAVQYGYEHGQVTSITDVVDGTTYWHEIEGDPSGRITQEEVAQGTINTTRNFDDSEDGVLKDIATIAGQEYIQNRTFTYDPNRNLESRQDHLGGHREEFCYDAVNRLTDAALDQAVVCGQGSEFHYDYTRDGNIGSKSDVGPFAYTSTQPHAVTQAGAANYQYDAFGNQVRRPDAILSYNAFQLPKIAIKAPLAPDTDCAGQPSCSCATYIDVTGQTQSACGSGSVDRFLYDIDGQRVQKISDSEARTYVAGGLYQNVFIRDLNGSPAVQHLYTIASPERPIAVVVRTVATDASISATSSVHYLHADGLGSVVAITDSAGSAIAKDSYDPFGTKTTLLAEPSSPIKAGFTGQEEDDDLGLVNMNGRMYDPHLGRFLSPDPVVQSGMNSQKWNRYAYAFNNPLKWVDPSGFDATDSETQGGVDPPSIIIQDFSDSRVHFSTVTADGKVDGCIGVYECSGFAKRYGIEDKFERAVESLRNIADDDLAAAKSLGATTSYLLGLGTSGTSSAADPVGALEGLGGASNLPIASNGNIQVPGPLSPVQIASLSTPSPGFDGNLGSLSSSPSRSLMVVSAAVAAVRVLPVVGDISILLDADTSATEKLVAGISLLATVATLGADAPEVAVLREEALAAEGAGAAAPRVFWSGGEASKLGAAAYAEGIGGTTLEMTEAGRALESASLPWSEAKPLWQAASRDFAAGTRGSADVFLGRVPRPDSIWSTIERPLLQQNGVTITTHLTVLRVP